MRVLLVGTHYRPYTGGIELHMAALAKALTRIGIDVRVSCVAIPPQRPTSRPSLYEDIPVYRSASYRLGDKVLWPRRLIPWPDVDVVHFHGFSRPLLAKTCVELDRRARLVITAHGGSVAVWHEPEDGLGLRLAKATIDLALGSMWLRRAAGVICLTRREAAHMVRIGARTDSIHVLSNPVPESYLRQAEAPREDSGRLLLLGRHAPGKRIDDLIRALLENPDLPPCDIVGQEGKSTPALIRLAEGLTKGRVRFVPPVSDPSKMDLIRRARCLVLCSTWEQQPIAALEAIAVGTPVVASEPAASGLPEGSAITYPLGDIRALAQAIRALDDPMTRSSIQDRQAAVRTQIPSHEQYASRLRAIYTGAVG